MVANFINQQVPPVNVEAEEAILGGILLDPHAMERVVDLLIPEAFSITHFRKIFQACKKLYEQDKPTDLMTVMAWLADRKQLEAVGGQIQLVSLVDRVVSAANIDQYATLVAEKYCRRKLMEVGEEAYTRASQTALNIGSTIEWLLERVHQLPFLSQEQELDTYKYNKCISEVRAIELTVADPGLKAWKLKNLAAKYDCSPRQLEEIYYRSLLAEDDEPMMTWEEAIEKHGSAIREWRMHGWLPKGKLIIEHGDGGAGKTRLGYNFLYHLATGQDWDGFPVKQGKCMVIQTDEAPSDMLQVLEDRGLANHPNIRYKTRWNVDFLQALEKEIQEFQPAFILIDSLTSINKRSIFSENDVEYARPLLLLKDLAQMYEITIMVIHHSSREGNARGSTAIRNSASEVWKLKVDNSKSMDGSHRVLEIEKSRSRKLASYLLRYNEGDGSWACLGKTSADSNEGGIGGPVKERIVRFLKRSAGVFFHTEEIQNEIGGGIDSVRRSCSDLANEGIISRKGRRPSLYGINFGDGKPDIQPTDPSGLSTPLLTDTTDQSVHAIAERSLTGSFSEPSISEPSSDFRSSDRENSVFFASGDEEKNLRSSDRLISCDGFNKQKGLKPLNGSEDSVASYKQSTVDDTTDQSVQERDRFAESGSNVAQLNNCIREAVKEAALTDAEVQDFVEMVRFAIAKPEAVQGIQETLVAYFGENPQEKNKVWQALTKNEQQSYKELSAKPRDGLRREVKLGDRVQDLLSDELGTVTNLNRLYLGSPKNRFVQWIATVTWDNGKTDDDIAAEFLMVLPGSQLTVQSKDSEDEPIDIKAITLHQPWASLVGRHKHYETSSWSTNYRGKIAIHASKFKPNCSTELSELAGGNLPLGAVIAIADLTDCIEMTSEFISQQTETEIRCGHWEVGRYAWKLENVQYLEAPIPARGYQGLWNWRPCADGSDLSTPPDSWEPKIGERCQNLNGNPLTIKETKGHSYVVVYDCESESEGVLHLQHLKPLLPEKDPRFIAQKIFEKIQSGDWLKARKHPDHKGFARRKGKVVSKRKDGFKLLAACETDKGIEEFNLEAVEVL